MESRLGHTAYNLSVVAPPYSREANALTGHLPYIVTLDHWAYSNTGTLELAFCYLHLDIT